MSEPLISIILPVYNGEKYLGKAIESCLAQSYKNIELIIVEDHSIDNSLKIAKKYIEKDSRIRLICNTQNIKLPASLNIGHNEAKGEFFTWTSHDNYYNPDAIRTMYESLISKEVDVVYTNYLTIDENDKLIDYINLKEIEYSFFYGVVGACFLYTKDFHLNNGEYDEDLFLLEDFDYWLRGLKHGKFFKLSNPGFYYYRYHKNSLTSQININELFKEKFLKGMSKCYSKIFDISDTLKEDDVLSNYFLSHRIGDYDNKIYPIQNISFFKRLEKVISTFQGINYLNLKRIIIKDCIEILLSDKKYQKIEILINLHRIAWPELLRLPMKRYIAILKKCVL